MAPKTKQADAYGFNPSFERSVVYYTCSSTPFYGRVGYALEFESMPSEPGRLAVQAAQAIAKDVGHGPGSAILVLQRMRRWMEDGKCTVEKIQAVSDMLDEAEDAGLPGVEDAISELVPTLKQRMKHEVAKAGLGAYNSRDDGDMDKISDMAHKVKALGINDVSVGTRVGGASFGVIESMRNLKRLPLGVLELDSELGGGMPRGQLGMFIGGAGDGKSTALNHVAAAAWMSGLFCLYATLELPDYVVLARLKANVTGVPIDAILESSDDARRKLEAIPLGAAYVKSFTPLATTVDDLKLWVKACEDIEGRPCDLLVVDYADKLSSKIKDANNDKGYQSMQAVYESLRIFADERKFWVWTASQASRSGKDSKKKVDLEHVADSMHKVRVADLVVTLNVRDEGNSMMFYVAKNRTGKSRASIGPMPVDFACGAVCRVARPVPGEEPGTTGKAYQVEGLLKEPGWEG